jgi:hypothetical protein
MSQQDWSEFGRHIFARFSHTRTSRTGLTHTGAAFNVRVVHHCVMPPLPTTFDDAANASIASIQRRQNDLREFQLPRLRGCTESLTVQQQYAAELREDLEAITRLVEVSLCQMLSLFMHHGMSVGLR